MLLGHDERAIEQSKIADGASPFLPNRKRATGITGNMFSKDHGIFPGALEMPEYLGRFAVETFAP
jgi:hypothetical protein